jgi:ERCC4-type nuclease
MAGTIYVTTAANDKDLIRPLQGVPLGLQHTGDVWFEGVSGGELAHICVERKHMRDLVNCINDGRHLQQIRQAHDERFSHYILIVEALWRESKDGEAEYKRGRNWVRAGMPWTRIQSYLIELHYLMGVHVIYSKSLKETVGTIKALHKFFETEEHDSLKRFYTAPATTILLRQPSLIRRMAKELSGIGWERSLVVEEKWQSVRDMVNAPVDEWLELEGIGKGIATKVQEELG